MKKRGVIIILLIILIPSVYADKEKLYSDKVYSGETVNVSNNLFTFVLASDYLKLSVTFPSGTGMMIYNSTCEIQDLYEVCFDGKEFWYHNYTTDKEYYKANVIIYKLLPDIADLELTRTIQDTELLVEEETDIDIKLENIGSKEATDIIYEDTFPSEFEIIDVKEALIYTTPKYSSVKWTGSLNKEQSKEISYKIKAKNKTSFESLASLRYHDGNKTIETNSDKETIIVSDYHLNMTTSLDKSRLEIGDTANLIITLNNTNDEEDIRAYFFLNKSRGIIVTEHRYLMEELLRYAWQRTLEPSESKQFNIKLKARYIGNYTLNIDVPFTIKDIESEIRDDLKLEIYARLLDIYYGSDKQGLAIEVYNPSKINSFEDIEVTAESTMPGTARKVKKLDVIHPTVRSKVLSMPFDISRLDSSENYSMNVNVKYQSDQGQIFQLTETKLIKFSGEKEKPITILNETKTTKIQENATEIAEAITPKKEVKKTKKSIAWLFLSLIVILLITLLTLFIQKEMKKLS